VLPIVELGGHAVHIPYHITWEHEIVDTHDKSYVELANISQLPTLLSRLTDLQEGQASYQHPEGKT